MTQTKLLLGCGGLSTNWCEIFKPLGFYVCLCCGNRLNVREEASR